MSEKRSTKSIIREVIFKHNTPASKTFDIILLIFILLSVAIVLLESVPGVAEQYHELLVIAEWTITILFTIEYILRIYSVKQKWGYIGSFYGIVDLISIVPTYLSLFLASSQYFSVIRALRLLRIFRILKLTRYLSESQTLFKAIQASRIKITVFLFVVFTIVIIIGAAMYIIEGGQNGFSSIPHSIYWAIVTLTTVGYGDIVPHTGFGKFLASVVMILGYGLIAVPTGILSAEIAQTGQHPSDERLCPICEETGHRKDADFCYDCGAKL